MGRQGASYDAARAQHTLPFIKAHHAYRYHVLVSHPRRLQLTGYLFRRSDIYTETAIGPLAKHDGVRPAV
jgi:hypothetical protein